MSGFPQAGGDQGAPPGYVYVFDTPSNESYIFIRRLAEGAQSKVNLVAHAQTRQVVVQKVNKDLLIRPSSDSSLLTTLAESSANNEEREIRILRLLHSFPPMPSFTPRWMLPISYQAIPLHPGQPRPCSSISYWPVCNGGSLAEWARAWREHNSHALGPSTFTSNTTFLTDTPAHNNSGSATPRALIPFPVSVIARCVAQISETLHVIYQAGPEAVYHCDLHIGNVFVHFPGGSNGVLPDFYLGDFGYARTANETAADQAAIADRAAAAVARCLAKVPGAGYRPPPPQFQPPPLHHQRRRWDMTRFIDTLLGPVGLAGSGGEMRTALARLMAMAKFLDRQDEELAVRNPRSRPPWLVELIREAKKLEEAALAAEQGTESFQLFAQLAEAQVEFMTGGKPFVLATAGPGMSPEMGKAYAENFGLRRVAGPWRLVDSRYL